MYEWRRRATHLITPTVAARHVLIKLSPLPITHPNA